jgi:hypothetical protein
MRCLADLRCERCGRTFYGDLPSGQALYTPMLLEQGTGEVHGAGAGWFADWLRDSYAGRTDVPVPFRVRDLAPVEGRSGAVLLNCLDTLYGHSLLKLLNAQHYLDHCPDLAVVVVIPAFLEWLVPAGVAQAWVVDLPLRRGTEWNDGLAREIRRRAEALPGDLHLSLAFSHPHPDDVEIERFTRVPPFPLADWEGRLSRPTVTFVWRDDRVWPGEEETSPRLVRGVRRRLGLPPASGAEGQRRAVVATAEALRETQPALDFAVVGLGTPGGFPDWILDLREPAPDEAAERRWCGRYAASHVVAGVHGSNMLLPSAHAGGVVELIGEDRAGNVFQDLLVRGADVREALFRYRLVPLATAPAGLARAVGLLLGGYPDFQRLMGPAFTGHGETSDTSRWRMR